MAAAPGAGYDRAMRACRMRGSTWAIAAALTALGVAITLVPTDGTTRSSTALVVPAGDAAGRVAAPRAAGRRGRARGGHGRQRHPDVRPDALRRRDPGRAADPLQPRGAARHARVADRARAASLAGIVFLLFTDPLLGRRRALPPAAVRRRLGSRALVRLARPRSLPSSPSARERLERTREERAALAVELERARLAVADLDAAARERDGRAGRIAGEPRRRAPDARETFAAIERQGRESLDEMRAAARRAAQRRARTRRRAPTLAAARRAARAGARGRLAVELASRARGGRCRAASSWRPIAWSSTRSRRWPATRSVDAALPAGRARARGPWRAADG